MRVCVDICFHSSARCRLLGDVQTPHSHDNRHQKSFLVLLQLLFKQTDAVCKIIKQEKPESMWPWFLLHVSTSPLAVVSGGERSLFTLATCVKPGKKALLSIIQHFFSLPFKWFNAQTALITYLGLVEHHLFRGEVGHRTEPAAAGGSAGAQCAEEDWGGEPSSGSSGYYMHDSGTRLLFTQRDKKKKSSKGVQQSARLLQAAVQCALTHVRRWTGLTAAALHPCDEKLYRPAN